MIHLNSRQANCLKFFENLIPIENLLDTDFNIPEESRLIYIGVIDSFGGRERIFNEFDVDLFV